MNKIPINNLQKLILEYGVEHSPSFLLWKICHQSLLMNVGKNLDTALDWIWIKKLFGVNKEDVLL